MNTKVSRFLSMSLLTGVLAVSTSSFADDEVQGGGEGVETITVTGSHIHPVTQPDYLPLTPDFNPNGGAHVSSGIKASPGEVNESNKTKAKASRSNGMWREIVAAFKSGELAKIIKSLIPSGTGTSYSHKRTFQDGAIITEEVKCYDIAIRSDNASGCVQILTSPAGNNLHRIELRKLRVEPLSTSLTFSTDDTLTFIVGSEEEFMQILNSIDPEFVN